METLARVIPSARATITSCELGLSAVDASSAALKGELPAAVSLLSLTPSTSDRPRSVTAEKIPGVTHLPVPSITSPPAGTVTPAPAATIRPLRTTTVAFSTGSEPSPVATVALVMVKSCAVAGATRASAAALPSRARRII